MIARYAQLRHHPAVFQSLTGLRLAEFDAVVTALLPRYQVAEVARVSQPTKARPVRQRVIGAGNTFALEVRDQVLLTLVWLRVYPTYPVLGYLFGVSTGAVERTLPRLLPLLEQLGQASMDRALAAVDDPARRLRRRSRRQLDDVLRDVPELAVVIDTFEQRVQRPQGSTKDGTRVADDFYSGKKKQHTLKTQVAVDDETGRIVDVPDSVPGPTSDLKVLKASGLLGRLPVYVHVGAAGTDVDGGAGPPRGGGRRGRYRRGYTLLLVNKPSRGWGWSAPFPPLLDRHETQYPRSPARTGSGAGRPRAPVAAAQPAAVGRRAARRARAGGGNRYLRATSAAPPGL